MKKIFLSAVFMSLSIVANADEDLSKYTILIGESAKNIADQCSREKPPKFEGIWVPDQKIISKSESKLSEIESLTSTDGKQITLVRNYYRQYVGIIAQGRRLIYINAFLPPYRGWRTAPISPCDGGDNYWGAVFDPETGSFSQLAINGP